MAAEEVEEGTCVVFALPESEVVSPYTKEKAAGLGNTHSSNGQSSFARTWMMSGRVRAISL